MEASFYILIPLFFLTAAVYSSAGLGGGSTYLAILALSGFAHTGMPLLALSCNIVVVTGGLWHFYRAGHFRLKNVLPFLITSVPFAYWGGSLAISKKTFSLLLAFSLAFAGLRLFFSGRDQKSKTVSQQQAYNLGLPFGAAIGFLSGLIGIGGGIFLSPLLLLMGWANAKQTAAAASAFIFVNSLAGLAGQLSKGQTFEQNHLLLPLLIAVFLGAQLGAQLGAFRISKFALQRVTACILLFASVRILAGLWW